MTDRKIEQLLGQLREYSDDVKSVDITVDVRVDIELKHTGEMNDNYQPIRDRSISENEMERMAQGEWKYVGEVDTLPEARQVTDKFTLQMNNLTEE